MGIEDSVMKGQDLPNLINMATREACETLTCMGNEKILINDQDLSQVYKSKIGPDISAQHEEFESTLPGLHASPKLNPEASNINYCNPSHPPQNLNLHLGFDWV